MFKYAATFSIHVNQRRLVAGLALGLAGFTGGCFYNEPQVTTQFPAPPKGAPYDPKAPPAKGQPAGAAASAGADIDAATGRMKGR